ncbi:Amino-acid carrier protein AlsT [anaerobic digester metagenome]|jgi:AGCS family alanine or glycine:cation symporter|uniref:alanine/glycine:cation symporter family protein n=1 Tax=Oscillibacter ruminantium TaxID=1263547 RepID=UPI002B215578|nr:sodium:alanine symporter family protein [Oscillibacter ruminantium]MEA5042439.1 sodium:alanine symporter family protein [Oscillibacter ruminantium]
MAEMIAQINDVINGFVWGVPMMLLIVGTGVYFTIRTGFLQFRKFGYAMKHTIGKCFHKVEAKEGSVTPVQALTTALAATVGTGNIAGVCGAIAAGGPGAIFWMWVSALFGMCTKFAEVTLAIKYRERNDKGDWVGGPMYYIKNGLGQNWKWLGAVFATFGMLAAFGIGNMTQVNTIATTVGSAITQFTSLPESTLKIVYLVIGIIVAIISAMVYLGGLKRIGNVTEKLVPFMAVIYIVGCLIVIVTNSQHIGTVFSDIFRGAFNPSAVLGGAIGIGISQAIKKGVGRGVFSNEAGLGSAPIAHAAADTDSPVKQGLFGVFEVFADTIIICTLTALTVMCAFTGNNAIDIPFGQAAGADLAITAFSTTFGGKASGVVVAIGLTLFALSTVLSWGLYGTRCAEFLFGSKIIKPYQVLFCVFMVVGATMKLDLAWAIADTLNGLMAIPNLVALLLLSPVVVKLVREYFADPARELEKKK